MENQEKIFEQFKRAADNMESKDFPSVEKVWSRVEDKLDKKVLTKQHNLWKKVAIAASVLLVVTLGYQLFKPEQTISIPQNEVVNNDIPAPAHPPKVQDATADPTPEHPQIKPEADKILKRTIEEPAAVAMEESPAADAEYSHEPESDMVLKSKKSNAPLSGKSARFQKGRAFDAVGVQRKDAEFHEADTDKKTETAVVGNVQAPLVIVDGKAITGEEALKINTVSEGIAKIDPKDEKEIVVLKEPLYIINGHYYSEQELFGPNPTSPYAPLNQQEIETITVFQGEKAIANYGKRGEKGVVVITTKDRKPAAKTEAKTSKK
ncbi:hypothetical protein [Flavobacterium caeni]|uniref:TonB-dependent outer membrane receptor, SusC/RagA subfamily, signature region n=1 Tax=Flavobacterium caeni TaxID=490189 RepID=A0A1G5AK13_9FLAO|nr:hypothetical protein [Flavobacterium caeni]SCX78160.1 hypothetical protein SAMN02927903_00030 [Flavobacterium caeni]